MKDEQASKKTESKKKGQNVTRALWFIAGMLCLFLGAIGIVLPILPTTPFLLAAAACFCKSSSRMYNWLLNNRWFGEYIKKLQRRQEASNENKNNGSYCFMVNYRFFNGFLTKPLLTTPVTDTNAISHGGSCSWSQHPYTKVAYLQKTRAMRTQKK